MATVWRAVHTTLGRPVAVKLLQAVGTQAKQMAARFVQEARLCANLRHRNVVDIIDFGVTPEEVPFMVMELLEGQSLADRYEQGPPLTDWDILEIAAMVLSGLGAVHDAGIIHRDVKPENIFLAEDADGTFPKLIDFGVSKGFTGGQRITRTGAVVGTPEYMSPEQARGVKEIGPPSDLWSVGILLYEGFTGDVPFESENPGDILIKVATQDVPSLGESRPDLPKKLIALVDRALHREPGARYQDARTMRDELLSVLEGSRDLRGRPPSSVVRTAYRTEASGKLKALSAAPPAPPRSVSAPEISVPPAASVPPEATPLPRPLHSTPPEEVTQEPIPLETEKLRPMPPMPPVREPRGTNWLAPLVAALLLGAGIAAFVAFDGVDAVRSAISGDSDDADRGARGAVRPGQDVAALAQPAEQELPAEEPVIVAPPMDGVPAAEAETVDVPSPPDPPEIEAESEL